MSRSYSGGLRVSFIEGSEVGEKDKKIRTSVTL